MDIKDIQNLIKFVSKAEVSEVKYKTKDFEITIKTPLAGSEMSYVSQPAVYHSAPQQAPAASAPQQVTQSAAPASAEPSSDDSKYVTIKSPMIGTFYRKPSPDKDVFVNVGDEVSNGKVVGVAFSGLMGADNIGYFIPTPIINHFLNDIKDGKYDGMPKLGIIWSELENPSYRKMLGVEDSSKGILIKRVLKNSPFEAVLKKGDVLLKLDNNQIEYDGTVEFRKNERTDFNYILQNKNFGEVIKYEIVRDKVKIIGEVKLTKDKIPHSLIKNTSLEEAPTYFVYGGLIFEPLTDDYINNGSSMQYPTDLETRRELENMEELAVLVRVLSDDANIGYTNYYDEIITKVNGENYVDFKNFVQLIKDTKTEFIRFEDIDGNEIVLDKKLVEIRNPIIFQNYSIDREMSQDLMK